MWFGTEDGLNKFDGKNFKVYRPDPSNMNSLTYRWIEHIIEDTYGNLWFGSRGGLNCFDPKEEVFIQYKYKPNNTSSISNDTITRIILDKYGLFHYNQESQLFTQIPLKIPGRRTVKVLSISEINDLLWIGTFPDSKVPLF
jgi:ligand-binding sensor domain-containing protein